MRVCARVCVRVCVHVCVVCVSVCAHVCVHVCALVYACVSFVTHTTDVDSCTAHCVCCARAELSAVVLRVGGRLSAGQWCVEMLNLPSNALFVASLLFLRVTFEPSFFNAANVFR